MTTLPHELLISLANVEVWRAIAVALVFGTVAFAFGAFTMRRLRVLRADAPVAETIAVGLSTGLVVLPAWWAAVVSGGRSSFTVVALAFLIAIAGGLVRSRRSHGTVKTIGAFGTRRSLVLGLVASTIFIVAVAQLYGATMAQSPREGVQPVEFMDEAFYSVLADDLARTGTESTLSPAGLGVVPGAPAQNWYHWGELWLAAAAIKAGAAAPLLARHFIALPLILLAAVALVGTLVRRVARTTGAAPFLVGASCCLFMAPVPFVSGQFFGSWGVGLIFGITQYGLAAVVVFLAAYLIVGGSATSGSWPSRLFVASVLADLVPSHIILAVLAAVGASALVGIRVIRRVGLRQPLSVVPRAWWPMLMAAAGIAVATLATGFATGHGLGGTAMSPSVAPFNRSWVESVAAVVVGAGVLLAVPIAWWQTRRDPATGDVYLAVMVVLAFGAFAWGARLGDFNMFHVFFGGLAAFAMPAAAVAAWCIWERVRGANLRRVSLILALAFVLQIEVGAVAGIFRLQRFGPGNYQPVPIELLEAIRGLPSDARVAYTCGNAEEVSFWVARLLAVGVHSEHRIVPMCFETDSFAPLVGGTQTADTPSPLFHSAPQVALYPTAAADPSSKQVAAWMRLNGIQYIYADEAHPNDLVLGALVIKQVGGFQLLRVP